METVKCEGCDEDVPVDDVAQDGDGVTFNLCLACQEA